PTATRYPRRVTVAVVILAATPESALADADGVPTVRRLADVAWSGGATPIVVVSFDPEGAVARALAGTPVTLAEPAPPAEGPVGQIRRGMQVSADTIRETSAALVWPARLVWVGAETVTSLIEAHGLAGEAMLRPVYGGQPGWPVLIPMSALDRLAGIGRDRMPDQVVEELAAGGVPLRDVELGDPGTVYDRETPSAELPPYQGPPEPPMAHAHEWGAALADEPEDVPLEGPSLAPYGQAEDSSTA
ncbi:MAG TPA: NTP transferase domain-containing protein, partial [Candidatus Limnocylindrales bacterium]|nr:NTP transferase domain-containing protein [Candidatus Limnocylindrales bacterium]